MNKERIVEFGYGPQNADGTDYLPVEWLVLDDSEGLLLISKNIMTAAIYDKRMEGISWEDSALRKTLNGEFLYQFVTERGKLLPVGIGPCPDDYVTILSYEEAMQYMPKQEDRVSEMTPYAAKKASVEGFWNLRMKEGGYFHCWSMNTDGTAETDYGFPADVSGVRPVIRIKK